MATVKIKWQGPGYYCLIPSHTFDDITTPSTAIWVGKDYRLADTLAAGYEILGYFNSKEKLRTKLEKEVITD